ncbi:regulatory protein RecX [Simiduia agarivorans]|uniref:Regulatory protein RecX n=1 Tax=Simiduia agarivorans (strain DSM 21679 / JCM 13881 / BCRC 17597 / SA1) TaxID=1117647 RepID=K4KP96_SIMAS|nr:regulatory protein RecX [Simiduia agarivorans]AFV01005.2 RecX family transcriptional regulator [Simiduia agarivorans SA1 = DSM 21679]
MARCATEGEVLDAAIRLLARREYSAAELRRKLEAKTDHAAWIDAAIERVQSLGYQSDCRYTESFIRYAVSQGKGPVWIRYQLQHKGLCEQLVSQQLADADVDWDQLAMETLARRFTHAGTDAKERAKQYRLLSGRGFNPDSVRKAMESLPEIMCD